LIAIVVLRTLATAIDTQPRFRVTFESVSWFGEDVLWLAPSPDGRSRHDVNYLANASGKGL
jgi:hypothetical protein